MTKTKHHWKNKIKRTIGRAYITGSMIFFLCVLAVGAFSDEPVPVGNGGIVISEWSPEHDKRGE